MLGFKIGPTMRVCWLIFTPCMVVVSSLCHRKLATFLRFAMTHFTSRMLNNIVKTKAYKRFYVKMCPSRYMYTSCIHSILYSNNTCIGNSYCCQTGIARAGVLQHDRAYLRQSLYVSHVVSGARLVHDGVRRHHDTVSGRH